MIVENKTRLVRLGTRLVNGEATRVAIKVYPPSPVPPRCRADDAGLLGGEKGSVVIREELGRSEAGQTTLGCFKIRSRRYAS